MIKYAHISLILFSLCSSGAMDTTRPISVGLVPINTEDGRNIYTRSVLLEVLQPMRLAIIEEIINDNCQEGPLRDYTFQQEVYDRRNAAIAAHIMLNGNTSLTKKKSDALYVQLKALGLQRMASVVNDGYVYHMFKPSIDIFEDENEPLPLSSKRKAVLKKNASAAFCGIAAYWALQCAISEGIHLADLDAYKYITRADRVVEYITNERLR